MSDSFFVDTVKKSTIVAKNEMKKYLRGKKILINVGILIVLLALVVSLPYIFGDGLPKDAMVLSSGFANFVGLFALLTAILFGATTIVSEFEERTALITFTKPIRRSSIFLGKLVATTAIGAVFIIVYYLAIAAISLIVAGEVVSELFASMVIALAYMMSTIGLSMFLSSVVKKGSTATLITFMLLIMILPILTITLAVSLGDESSIWWMLDMVAGDIVNVFGGDPVNIAKTVGVLLGWFAIPTVLSFLIFRRKNF